MFHQRTPRAGEISLATSVQFYRGTLTLLVATFFLISCKDDPPTLTGANETFTTSGRADDGDDVTTPPSGGVPYTNPTRTATDGPAKAVSDTGSYKSLRGNVIAQTGPQAGRVSTATSFNRVTSTFVVAKAVTLKFEITSSASAMLNSGSGGYRVEARILDNAGQQVARFTTRFDFTENANGKNDVAQDNIQFTQVDDGDPIQSPDRGPRTAFALQPGSFTLEFKLNIEGEADTRADINVSASLDLVVP